MKIGQSIYPPSLKKQWTKLQILITLCVILESYERKINQNTASNAYFSDNYTIFMLIFSWVCVSFYLCPLLLFTISKLFQIVPNSYPLFFFWQASLKFHFRLRLIIIENWKRMKNWTVFTTSKSTTLKDWRNITFNAWQKINFSVQRRRMRKHQVKKQIKGMNLTLPCSQ